MGIVFGLLAAVLWGGGDVLINRLTVLIGTSKALVWTQLLSLIFWVVYAYQNPVKLLHRYPGRFPLMHVKDIRKGIALGGSPGDVLEEDSVPLGKGIVDIPATLRAAKETGVRHYYIEDEAVDADKQIPESLRYLNSVHV